MQNKKRLYKHLMIIYIIYFAALIVGFSASFVPDFSRGWSSAKDTLTVEQVTGGVRSYYVMVPLQMPEKEVVGIEGMPENITPSISQLELRVTVNEGYTFGNAFKVIANNGYAYLLTMVSAFSYLAIFILIALIINSLRKSIRDEHPLRDSNIIRTRFIGALVLVAELSEALMKYIHNTEASRLLTGTSFEVSHQFSLDYWNIIVGILFLFMAELISISTQLSEEQKLTI